MTTPTRLFAVKGEAAPAVRATAFTNPALAFLAGRDAPRPRAANAVPAEKPPKRKAVTVRFQPEEYLRLKDYVLGQGVTLQYVAHTAVTLYLESLGVMESKVAPAPSRDGAASLLDVLDERMRA